MPNTCPSRLRPMPDQHVFPGQGSVCSSRHVVYKTAALPDTWPGNCAVMTRMPVNAVRSQFEGHDLARSPVGGVVGATAVRLSGTRLPSSRWQLLDQREAAPPSFLREWSLRTHIGIGLTAPLTQPRR